MNFSPVIIPTMNRYEHLKRLIDSLAKNKFAPETELYIGFDYPPPNKGYEDGYKKIKDYLPTITGFNKVHIIERDKNWGAIENIKDLIRIVIAKHDRFIFTDDDNSFSPCFLEYINNGLEKFKDDKTILSIQGFSYPIEYPTSESNVVKMQRYYSDWGYGIWKDRYEMLRDTITQEYFNKMFYDKKQYTLLRKKSRKNYIYAFGLCSPEKTSFRINPIRPNIRPMDYTSSIFQCVNNMYSIMPKTTLVKNNGWDNSGIHCQDINSPIARLFIEQKLDGKDTWEEFILDENETNLINEKVDKSLIGQYSKKIYIKTLVKHFLYRFNIIEKLVRKK